MDLGWDEKGDRASRPWETSHNNARHPCTAVRLVWKDGLTPRRRRRIGGPGPDARRSGRWRSRDEEGATVRRARLGGIEVHSVRPGPSHRPRWPDPQRPGGRGHPDLDPDGQDQASRRLHRSSSTWRPQGARYLVRKRVANAGAARATAASLRRGPPATPCATPISPRPGEPRALRHAPPRLLKRAGTMSDHRAKIRMYRHGLGDCHLVRLTREGKPDYTILIDCGVILGTLKRHEAKIAEVMDGRPQGDRRGHRPAGRDPRSRRPRLGPVAGRGRPFARLEVGRGLDGLDREPRGRRSPSRCSRTATRQGESRGAAENHPACASPAPTTRPTSWPASLSCFGGERRQDDRGTPCRVARELAKDKTKAPLCRGEPGPSIARTAFRHG